MKFKKYLLPFLAVFAAVCMLFAFAACGEKTNDPDKDGEHQETEDDTFSKGLSFYWDEEHAGYAVSGGDCEDSEIIIPAVYQDKPVVAVASWGVGHSRTAQKIVLPDSITLIERNAFRECDMTEISLPEGLLYIGWGAFLHCENLKSITIPDSVALMEENVFMGCSSLKSVTIGKNLKTIADWTFSECINLRDVTLGENVSEIKLCAFADCVNLQSVTLNNLLTSIGTAAFRGCNSLRSIEIPDSVSLLDERAFQECSRLETVTIGNGVLEIKRQTFTNCTALRNVTIGNSVRTIGEDAFSNCTVLMKITIPDSVKNIRAKAFANCALLSDVTIGTGVTSISDTAFALTMLYTDSWNWHDGVLYCGNYLLAARQYLSGEYEVKEGTVLIADKAFYGCMALENFILPDSVRSIGISAFVHTAFYGNYGNTKNWEKNEYGQRRALYLGKHLIASDQFLHDEDFVIKEGTLTISDDAFTWTNWTSITIPNSVRSIGQKAFWGCRTLTSIEIPNSVTEIGDYAFYDCNNLKTVILPETITQIGDWAFDACGFESFVIPESTTFIGNGAFSSSKLTSIVIPKSVKIIGEKAFYFCDFLTDITYGGTKDEWNAVVKCKDWDCGFHLDEARLSPDRRSYTVHCTDGEIKVKGKN